MASIPIPKISMPKFSAPKASTPKVPSSKAPKSSFFSNMKNKLSTIGDDLNHQREKINLDDTLLGDNTFFKFLDDLLKSLKKENKKDVLLDELKENEELSKEKFLTIFTNSLEENEKLSKEQKDSISKSLSNKYVQDLAFNLVSNKLNKQTEQKQESEDDIKISAKDVVEVGMDIAKNPTPVEIAKTIGKQVVKKVVHKPTK